MSDSHKIGRNEPCPCGSGMKYKRCCYGKSEEEIIFSSFKKLSKEARRKSFFKECLHPDKCNCSEKIIKAHTIQRNKILTKIAENGIVLMPCPKSDFSLELMHKYGLAEATVFSGFCSYHDKTTFQPIEDRLFTGTEEQVFLFTYRAFAYEYYRKRVASSEMGHFASSKYYDAVTVNGKNGFELSTMDYEAEKQFFDEALLSKNYGILTSIVWEFEGESHFAATGGEAPVYDAEMNQIQDISDPNKCVRHIYYSAFPQNGKTYFIISWIKAFDAVFKRHYRKLLSLSLKERTIYVNNTLPITTEIITISPSSWKHMEKEQIDSFGMLFWGIADYCDAIGTPYDRLQDPGFDLFSI